MIKFKYEFTILDSHLLLAVGESYTDVDGNSITVKRYRKEHLAIKINNMPELILPKGEFKRIPLLPHNLQISGEPIC